MATYAIGDIQGCLQPFRQLLEKVDFRPGHDTLWLAGDLVNRGPESLETLRLIISLGESVKAVLGNHDLSLLAMAHGARDPGRKDTIVPILNAPDRNDLLQWLRRQPLLHHDADKRYVMTHAGIPPTWSLSEARAHAGEVEAVLQGDDYGGFLDNMYGNQPDIWSDDLTGWARLRMITNYLTRMRFCTADGRLDLNAKEGIDTAPQGFAPWFSHPGHRCGGERIIFGHWAALQGVTDNPYAIALDTGCVWGGSLTAMRLEDERRFSVGCTRG